ncbi:MAG: DUF4493 domain-containing protein [Muribaculaceae bacterium]|nr:DUF4493 domain-containing protein [Muribaculaceae bacterium]
MKHNIFNILTVCASLSLGLTSCHDNPDMPAPEETRTGQVQLSSLGIEMNNVEQVINSSAGRTTTDVNDFIVTITPETEGLASHVYRYGDMPEVLTLPVGKYDIKVESHKIEKAAWEAPYYTGSTEFSITDGEITNIGTIIAKFASLKVTVIFSDDLRKVIGDDVTVTVYSNDEGELVFTPQETRSGYFEVIPGSTTMVARFVGTIDGVRTEQETSFADIAAGQHRIITYKTKAGPEIPEQTGSVSPGIGLDTDIESEDLSGNVTVDENDNNYDNSDRPGHEELPDVDDPTPPGPDVPDNPGPDDQPAATFEATDSPNLKLDEVNTVSDDFGNAIVTIFCEKGIKNLVVTINTDSDDFSSALEDLGLNEPFDLAYPGDLEDKIGEDGLGLATGDKVINQTEVPFDITLFVPMLAGFPGLHTFTLSVTDNDNNIESLTLRFKAE